MKRLIITALFSLPVIAGCQQGMAVKQEVDAVLSGGVSAYCKLPETARLINRGMIAAKIAPNRIQIICAGDSGISSTGD